MVAGSDRDRQTLNRHQCWKRMGDHHTVGTAPHSQTGTTTQSGQLHTVRRGLPHSRDSSTQSDGDYHTVGTAPHSQTGTTTQSGQLHTVRRGPPHSRDSSTQSDGDYHTVSVGREEVSQSVLPVQPVNPYTSRAAH